MVLAPVGEAVEELAELVEVGAGLDPLEVAGELADAEEAAALEGVEAQLAHVGGERLGVERADLLGGTPRGRRVGLVEALGGAVEEQLAERGLARVAEPHQRHPSPVADRPGRKLQTAEQRLGVGGVVDDAEQRQQRLDLGLAEVAATAVHLVRDSALLERGHRCAHVVVTAEEPGDVGAAGAGVDEPAALGGDGEGLGALVGRVPELDRDPVAAVGDELLVDA